MLVERDVTQEKLAKMSLATLQHTPNQEFTLADRLEEKAEKHRDRRFILFEDRELSYGEVNAEANRMAHAGIEMGLRRGDVAALMMENRPEFLISWMGMAKLGVTVGLLNTNVRGRALLHEIRTTGAKHVLVSRECAPALAEVAEELAGSQQVHVRREPDEPPTELPSAWNDVSAMLEGMPTENPASGVRAGLTAGDDLFYVFTSGTTGLPKAARLSHMRYLGVGDAMSAVAGYGPDDVIACVLPLYHGAGGMVVVSCALTQGATIMLRRKFSVSSFWDDARRYGVTGCQYIGEICRYLLNQPERSDDRNHSVRVLMGAGLGPEIWEEFQQRFGIERILEGWSSTEANTSLINLDNRVGSCGRIPHKELHNGRLVAYDIETGSHPTDEAGFLIECRAGETGEFVGRIPDLPNSGAGRFEGYTAAEATAQKILENVFEKGDRWYRSGDLLRHDEEGYFYFVDRIGDTFRWKSENVSTQEVAEALGTFPGLEIANIYGVAVPGHEGRAGMAALVLGEGEKLDRSAFYAFVEKQLPRYAAPVFVRIVRSADMTSTFKLRKVDLQRQGYDSEAMDDPVFVRDEGARSYVILTAEALARI